MTDLARMGSLSDQFGVRLFLGDSTNACEKGSSRSETSVGKVLFNLFHEAEGKRIITTCFASHIHRVQQIADAAIHYDRVIATMGMSMKKNVRLAREMGLLNIPENRLLDIDDIKDLDPAKVCVISTGSQGEADVGAGRWRRENRWITLGSDDVVIGARTLSPGNEANVTKVIDGLTRLGVEVVHSGIEDVHATGHAKQEELKTVHSILRPDWFIPVHGEYHHLVATPRSPRP
jgi:ribonuclease J